MKWIRRSLANTLSFFIAIILLVVFCIIGLSSFSFMTQTVKMNLLEKTYIQSESISKDVANIFENAQLYTKQMALNPDITAYLKTVKTREAIRSSPYYTDVYDYLIKIKESNTVHFLAWVANEQANFYLDSSGVAPDADYEVTKRPWYTVAINSSTVAFTPPYVEWETRKTVISSILALREGAEVYGFVVVDIMLDSIPEIFKNVALSEADKSFLVTHEGEYIYHENPDQVMNASLYDETDPLNAYVDSIFSPKQELVPILYEGKSYYLMSYSMDNNKWQVITLLDRASINAALYGIYFWIVFLMVIAFMLAVGSIHLMVRRHTKPYKLLVAFAGDIASGDYSKNIPQSHLNREDEMGAICNSFQSIITTFRNENVVLEEKIREKNKELEQQYQYIIQTEKAASLGNLVAGVAHEINTPLGVGISTASHIELLNKKNLKLIELGKMTKADLIEYFESIGEATYLLSNNLNRAAELVKSFKKIAVNQSNEVRVNFNLKETIEDVILSLRGVYKRQQHRIRLKCDEEIELNSFPGAYSQIMTNLIMNSIEHGFKDRMNGLIQIECQLKPEVLILIYEDNGRGIEREHMKKIFEPFFTTNRQNGNSGLGMNVIYNIITQSLLGKITLESKVDQYTRFVIEIPLNTLSLIYEEEPPLL
ncbi:sensor histidine kinase [Fusibacter sp. 3D3]|uniref:sensor histidine kinase n=1 Tax=Fusibacter sp. 3D3 TaxID=1048380 RepID=UPI000858AD89|nr:sensor histidine kinase [Fusibacter sp. 3D3]GAU77077.1 signal transduction histidine kinase [Fusibacter sp. 3D3]